MARALLVSRAARRMGCLRLGAHLNVAVNPANPSRELTVDSASSPVAG